jgi:hypothetical protein
VNIAVGDVGGLAWTADGGDHETPVGCSTDVDIGVHELNGYCVGDVEFFSGSTQSSTFLGSDSVASDGLPAGITVSDECHEGTDDSCLGCDLSGRASCTKTVTHTPSRGDEGSSTEVCFTAADAYGAHHAAVNCISFSVPRCRYCAQEDDTLHDISNDYCLGTNWLRLWNSNPQVTDPDVIFHDSDLLNIGPVYHVQQGDTIRALSHRFSTTDHTILELNPDIEDQEQDLTPGQPLCVTPCSNKPDASSNTYTWGY